MLSNEKTISPQPEHTTPQTEAVEAVPQKGIGRWFVGGLWGGIKRLLKTLALLIAGLYIILWIPWVQVQIGHVFAYAMSKAWDTHVSIDRVEITPLSNFKFHNFFIQDHYNDTLIFAKYAEAQHYNVLSLFKKKIDIGNVIVKDAIFKVQRFEDMECFNIHFLISFFEAGGERVGPRPKKFELHFGGADLVNARIHLYDAAIGTEAIVTCDTGYVHGHGDMGVDMIGKHVWGDKAHLAGLNLTMRLFDKVDVPNMDTIDYYDIPVDSTIPYWNVGCEKLLLNDLSFKLINERSDIQMDSNKVLDFANLYIKNINLDVDTFRLDKEVFSGRVNQLHGLDHGGFEIKKLSGDAVISPNIVAITNFNLETNNSKFGHALVFKYNRYRDFFEFPDKVNILGTFDSTTTITFRDIAAFAPVVKNNVFIKSNLDEPIHLQGKFKGTVNNFRARDVDIQVANHSLISGNLSMNDITIPDAAFMDLSLKEVQTDYQDLKKILPFVQLPPNLATLGKINFKGSYTGFFQDFVAYGQLDTKLGSINSDLQLNLRKGKKSASYNGGLSFDNFDIGTYLANNDLGHISVSSKVKGIGLTLETLDAELQNAKIDSFTFKNYQYEDIQIDGFFKSKKFEGDVISKDTFMNFFVRGIMDLNGDLPKVDILGNVNNIDFKKVNITQEKIGLHLDTFDINAMGNNLDNFTGTLSIRGINGHRGKIYSELNGLSIKAINIPSTPDTIYSVDGDTIVIVKNTRSINLKSDIIDLNVFGEYDVVNLVRSIDRFIKINHPNLYRELYKKPVEVAIDEKEPIWGTPEIPIEDIPHQDFSFVLNIPSNTQNITQLFDKNFKSLDKIFLTGHYDGSDGYLKLEGDVGKVHIGDIGIEHISIKKGRADGPTFVLQTTVGALSIKDSTFIPNIILSLDAVGDNVHFIARADAVGKIADSLAFEGKLEISENLVVLRLDTSQLNILNERWTTNGNNHIKIGDKVLDIENVALSNGIKRVSLNSVNDRKGAQISIENMDLGWLYGMMEPLPKIEIDGLFSGDVVMNDVFTQKELSANILLDTLIINGDYWGSNSRLTAKADSLKSTFQGLFTHSSNFVDSLKVTANFTPAFATKEKFLQNMLDINATAEGAKANILEYFLKEQISETEGYVNAKARVFGKIDGKKTVLNIEGNGDVKKVKTKVNFLQTKYVLSDGKVKIDNKGFHITPTLILKGNNTREKGGIAVVEESEPSDTAYIGGSLTHNHLKDFGLDFFAVLDNNLAMKTTLEDNSTFYGTVYASGIARFTGPFQQLKLRVEATTEDNTDFNLPVGGPLEVSEKNYITFVDKKQKIDSSKIKSIKDQILSGLDIEIIADIKKEAIARLIIDEKAGDIIEGRGKSDDLRISYSPTGELKIFGTYVIEEGNYLFTYKNIINKPFEVQKGGTVTWGENDGDPYKAQLNLAAVYKKNLGVSNLVKSYTTGNPELSSLANKPCEVELLMGLKGELFSPEINFDFNIENVPSRLQNPVSLALRAIRNDKNELNRQVFGIIALQQFLPLENAQNVNVVSSGINTGISTVSELVSQQLSLYINDLLEGVIKNVDFISSLEFDFNFNIRDSDNQTINSRTSNVRVGSDIKFLNDRLRVYAGANMDIASDDQMLENNGTNNNYVGGDFIVEYYITNDGQLKVKAYNRTESTILGRSTRTGIGFSYKKEFNTLQDLFDEAKENKVKRKGERYESQIKNYKKKLKKLELKIAAATNEKKKAALVAQKEKYLSLMVKASQNLIEHKEENK